jgi:16S rRNA (cytosine1402-N4)-methyltransferase
VLLDRVVALVAPALERAGSVFVDATLGLGGHAEAVLDRCRRLTSSASTATRTHWSCRHPAGSLRGAHDPRARGVRRDPDVLAELGIESADGILFDLGVSSMQLDVRERGFAYAEDAPLDMRWTTPRGPTAADVLNSYPAASSPGSCAPTARRSSPSQIARAIVRAARGRAVHRLRASGRPARETIPAPARRTGGHPRSAPSRRCASRSTTSSGALRRAIPAAIESIGVGGRVVVMSYHSLEDRLVKQAFAAGTTSIVPPDLPVVPARYEPPLRSLTRGAEKASPTEIAQNPRAASVRLRAVERLNNNQPHKNNRGDTAA